MLTFDQTMKAIKALARSKGENPEKRLALELHKKAKREAFTTYHLPYRCYYDYLKNRANNPSDKLMLNPCWPNPGYPTDKVIRVSKNEFDITKELLNGSRPYEEIYIYDHLKPEVREQVTLIINRFCTWSELFCDTWKRYFLKFLKGYDFTKFTCFDFFGATLGEVDLDGEIIDESQIDLMQSIYDRLQKEYNEDPSKYDYEDPLSCEEYLYLYQDKPFTIEQNQDEIKEAIDRAKALNKPMSNEEEVAYMKRYGGND